MKTTELAGCSPDDERLQPLVVLDAVGEWDEDMMFVHPVSLETNNYWTQPDREVTGSQNQLSAVWPSLRHGHFNWKVKQHRWKDIM